jgi:short-subunit dehydrogenase
MNINHAPMVTTTFITGASSGIGSSLAIALAKKGHRIALFSRREKQLEEIKTEIEKNGGEALVVPGDVTDPTSIKRAFEKIEREWVAPDIIVANAGVAHWIKTTEMELKKARQTVDVNLMGLINTVQLALPRMINNGGGHIVGIASAASYRGIPNLAVYSATKAGIVQYLEGVRVENNAKGIVVTTICPGFIETPMVTNKYIPKGTPLPFMMDVEKSTKKIISAIEHKRSHYTYPLPMAILGKIGLILPNSMYDKVIIPFARWWLFR